METRSSADSVWRRPVWVGLLVAASAALTTVFTCITPFAAFSVIVASSFSRTKALSLTAVLWFANQAVGYGVLQYPWTANSAAWGVAIGGAAVLGTLAAYWSIAALASSRASLRILAGFALAFTLYELTLYVAAVSILGGTQAFAPTIVGQVLLVNAMTLVGLHGLEHCVAAAGGLFIRRRRAGAAPARLA